MRDREIHLCLRDLENGERCHEAIHEIDELCADHVWKCTAGHVWYGSNPNVLKLTPWRKLKRRERARRWFDKRLKLWAKIQSPSIARGDD